ncbi:phenylacetate--CoA ligase family protein [Tautonia plasticadhaerens]|uniref:Phenylacetate-coenzyme A ligase n=1 Tax=Tautonia plasticadhaerens TaxID=2527974 RepID=A0A518GY70_9BACT|nr:phenylacetate--CoA ligase family protein [Tautonia plasticadhaerens]QDV33539.1 Phenylacetate-coenzyme A ligase [Tautonia plasticadhaerens]
MIRFTVRSLLLSRVSRMDRGRVLDIQRRRLRSIVSHARMHSAFYREKYRGIDPDRLDLADLEPTTKSELMADFDRVVTDPAIRRADLERFLDDPGNEGRRFLGKYVASHTSGSQGQPMLIVQPRSLTELMFGFQMTRGNARKPTPTEAARRLLSPARLAIVTLKRGFYPSATVFQSIPAAARPFLKVLWLSQTDPDVVSRLNDFRPTVLTGYAGVLEELALHAEAGRLKLSPGLEQVVNNSEVLTDRARLRIESAFGRHVMNNYATGECTFLSNGCPTDAGAHVNADWAILEVVDAQNRPVPDGTPGSKVLITNLANTTLPFIRYEVGDIVTMAATPCRCGSKFPRVERIDGRTADTFWIEEGGRYRQLISSVFKNAFDYAREVREWQAVQVDRNRFVVRIELLQEASLDGPHLWRALDRQLEMYRYRGVVSVSIEVVDRLGPDPTTGKFRRIVSLVGPPKDLEHRLRVDPPHRAAGSGPATITSRAARRVSNQGP